MSKKSITIISVIALIIMAVIFSCSKDEKKENPVAPSPDNEDSITLSIPTGVSASDGTYTDKVRITWSSVSNAEKYYVYRSISDSGSYSEIVNTTTTSYDDTTAIQGTTYYYKVKAYSSSAEYSEFSSYNSGYRAAPGQLPAPTGVTASDGTYTDKVRITWNSVSGVEKYYVYRATSELGTYSEIGNTTLTTYDDTTVTADITYYYKIKAWSTLLGYSIFSSYDGGQRDLESTDILSFYWNGIPKNCTFSLTAETDGTDSFIAGYFDAGLTEGIWIAFPGFSIGNWTTPGPINSNLGFLVSIGGTTYSHSTNLPAGFSIDVTSYGIVGERVIGTFSGSVVDNPATSTNIITTGVFNIIRIP